MREVMRLGWVPMLLGACMGAPDTNANQHAVELCNNSIDDTGNGLVDCADPACAANIACGAGASGRPFCGDGRKSSAEVCDGPALAGASCVTEGFAGGTLACNSTCTGFDVSACDAAPSCDNGSLDPGEACDGSHLAGQSCVSLGYGGGSLHCSEDCGTFDTSQCTGFPNCGNSSIDGLDACDRSTWRANSEPACSAFGLGDGTARCTSECAVDFSGCAQTDYCAAHGWYNDGVCDPCEGYGGSIDPDCQSLCTAQDDWCSNRYDTFTQSYVCNAAGLPDPDCGTCGNGELEGTELCDGSAFSGGGSNCEDYGFAGGTLGCRDDCRPDFTECYSAVCGNGQIDGGEACDGNNFGGATCRSLGYVGGSLRCNSECQFVDTSSCTGAGTYDNGALDAKEWCDGPGGPFLHGSDSCASFGMGEGTITCGPNGVDFSQCRIWQGNQSAAADYCQLRGWYNDGVFCDPCEALGGMPDPDCAALCDADGTCSDLYNYSTRSWGCPQPDPDCGTCGNGTLQGFEECDGNAFRSSFQESCQTNGFVGGTPSCRDDCTVDFSGCTVAVCGNGVVEGNEVCDGGSLPCASLGFSAGSAPCRNDCTGYEEGACSGIASCGNGRIDAVSSDRSRAFEYCDGDAFFTFDDATSAQHCTTFGLGRGSVTCTSACELDLSGCEQQDFCSVHSLRGDGVCDLCEEYGGVPDPDCTPQESTYGCGLDGVCRDHYDVRSQKWPCQSKGLIDPDCGFCGNNRRETGEYCDGDELGALSCATYGYGGGTARCTSTCVPDVSACVP